MRVRLTLDRLPEEEQTARTRVIKSSITRHHGRLCDVVDELGGGFTEDIVKIYKQMQHEGTITVNNISIVNNGELTFNL